MYGKYLKICIPGGEFIMGLFDFFKKKESKNLISTDVPTVTTSINKIQEDIVPIEEKIRGKLPTCDSLYPHEILVLSYATKFMASKNEFQKFWWYQYGIKDVQVILSKLELNNFIEIGSIADTVMNQKLNQLKQILKTHGLKVNSKKEDIAQRVLNNISLEELNVLFPVKPYKLTQSGENLLKKYEWIPYIHKHNIDGLDIWNLTEMVQTPPYTNYRDKIWGYFNKIGIEYIQDGQFGLYRNIRFEMSEFLIEEHKDTRAFKLLCEVIAYDLSGLNNGFNIEHITMYYNFFYPFEKSIVTMAPGITKRVEKMSSNFGWNEKELFSALLQELSDIQLPFSIFTPEEKVEIVIAEINNDTQKLEYIYNMSAKRIKKQYNI